MCSPFYVMCREAVPSVCGPIRFVNPARTACPHGQRFQTVFEEIGFSVHLRFEGWETGKTLDLHCRQYCAKTCKTTGVIGYPGRAGPCPARCG